LFSFFFFFFVFGPEAYIYPITNFTAVFYDHHDVSQRVFGHFQVCFQVVGIYIHGREVTITATGMCVPLSSKIVIVGRCSISSS
jgi:hypothetical protein